MIGILASALLLQPVLHDPGQLRVVALGADVEWELDGLTVARTESGQAATFFVDEGRHELWAVSASDGEWQAFARLEPDAQGGATYVPSWTARHLAVEPGSGPPRWVAPVGLAGIALAILAWPRSRRRPAAVEPPDPDLPWTR